MFSWIKHHYHDGTKEADDKIRKISSDRHTLTRVDLFYGKHSACSELIINYYLLHVLAWDTLQFRFSYIKASKGMHAYISGNWRHR